MGKHQEYYREGQLINVPKNSSPIHEFYYQNYYQNILIIIFIQLL